MCFYPRQSLRGASEKYNICIFLNFIFFVSGSTGSSLLVKGDNGPLYNGIDTSIDEADEAIEGIKILVNNSKIDSKKVIYERAYNYSESRAKDILESAVQRIPQSYLNALHVSNAYAAYSQLLQGNLIQSIASSILNSIVEKKLEILADYSLNHANLPEYITTLGLIKEKYNLAYARGERVFAISHSQGSLFMNDVYNLLPDNDNKNKYFTGFQIASVLGSEMDTRFGYATNSKDRVVNAVRLAIGALPANLETPFIVSNDGYDSDSFLNHGILSTYLHDSKLKSQVNSRLIATANLQESNCFYANIEYTKNNLQVIFDSGDPQDRNPEGLTYVWAFGDGQTATTNEELFPHTYLQSGTYSVSLTVKDQSGNEVSTNSSIVVVDAIKAVISYTKNNLTVSFDSTGNIDLTGLTYAWDFKDGKTSVAKAPSHTYSVAGTYNVSLTVTDSYGASDTANVSVIVTSGGASVTFCNIGNLTSTMDFSLSSGDAFSLYHYQPTYQEHIDGTKIQCECRTLNLQQNSTYNLTVGGTLPDIGAMIPYIGLVTIKNQQEVFSTSYQINAQGRAEFLIYRGAAFGNSCEEYIAK